MKKWLGIAVIFSSLCVGCAEIAYDALDFSVEGKFLTDWENCSLLAEAACQGGIGSDEVEALARCYGFFLIFFILETRCSPFLIFHNAQS